MRPRARWLPAALAGLVALAASACSEESPQGRELSSPAERDAAPVGEQGLERTEAERRDERLEAFGLEEEEPGEARE